MYLSVICLLLILMDGAYGSGFGSCPEYPVMENFDISQLEGNWYEYKKSLKWLEYPSGCTYFFLMTSEMTNDLSLFMNIIDGRDKQSLSYEGSVVQEKNETSTVYFKVDNNYGGKYQVLDADYEHFVILWSCSSWGWLYYFDQILVISRRQNLSSDVLRKINDSLYKKGLDLDRLVLGNKLCFF